MSTRNSTSATPSSAGALQLLREDHRHVAELFRDFAGADDAEVGREIVERACAALKLHATLEEELFYPALRDALQAQHARLIDAAEVEHDSMRQLIARLESLEGDDPYYTACFSVLAEYVRHHVKAEESVIFPLAEQADLDLVAIAHQMRARKADLMEDAESAGMAAQAS